MKTTAENQEIYKTEALLQFALMHGDEDEAARLREKLMRLTGLDGVCQDCKPVRNGDN